MRWGSFLLRIIGLAVVVLAVSACSAIKLGYNQLPDITYWWLDSYVDVREPQVARLREEITNLHAWHRQTELPRYASLLDNLALLATGPVTPEQSCAALDDMRTRFTALTTRLEPAAVWLAQQLTPEQLAHLKQRQADNDVKWRKQWLDGTPAEAAERRVEMSIDRSEDFYGSLQDPQLAAIRATIARSGYSPRIAWAERQRRQQDLLQTLERVRVGGMNDAQTLAALRGWLDRALNPPDPVHRDNLRITLREGCEGAARLHNSTTAEQRERAVRRLRAYARDLRELAGLDG
ncbi:MAG: hypothetical protein K2X51_14120 [Burkholderiales bacterium]|nr:hypothetical protein [Burkholderiales bacterium]